MLAGKEYVFFHVRVTFEPDLDLVEQAITPLYAALERTQDLPEDRFEFGVIVFDERPRIQVPALLLVDASPEFLIRRTGSAPRRPATEHTRNRSV